MKKDDYLLGPHHFWIHFWCGLVVGAGLGARISWVIFDNRAAIIASAVGITFACCCGRWGESAWTFLFSKWRWWR